MKQSLRSPTLTALILCLTVSIFAQEKSQEKKPGVLAGSELKLVVPTNYFFEDQVAPVQMRNSVAIRAKDGKIVAAGLVDNSGYSTDVAQKYQGFLIASKKINLEGKSLEPGQYGFGFVDGKFRVMDVGGNDVLTVEYKTDEKLQRPAPFKAFVSGAEYRLYAGKKYVSLSID